MVGRDRAGGRAHLWLEPQSGPASDRGHRRRYGGNPRDALPSPGDGRNGQIAGGDAGTDRRQTLIARPANQRRKQCTV